MIIAYTHENINNIKKELCDAYGYVPELTKVMTFHSFLYRNIILPYVPSISEHFHISNFDCRGVCMNEPPPQIIKENNKTRPNPQYISKDNFQHYINNNQNIYCSTFSELVLQVKKKGGTKSLVDRAAARLNLFYDAIFIDEFQDFRNHDYELITKLFKKINNVIMVGDYYQHSVSAKNNSGKPFKKNDKHISYEEFIDEIKKLGTQKKPIEIDTTTLAKSRRCSFEICEYISHKLGIKIDSYGKHKGHVILVDSNAQEILNDNSIIKLVYKNAAKYSFRAMNWSYSKGDTVDAACVILPQSLNSFSDDIFSLEDIPTTTINKLYVAMTRSRGNLYIIRHSTFEKIKSQYII